MPSPEPVYLRAHSYFGFLESFLSPEDLAHLANSGGIRTLALTDHQHLSGALEFYTCCRNMDITPNLGLVIDQQWEGHSGLFTLLAKDRQGWSNLCRVSSRMALESRAMTLSDLTQCHQGLIAIAAAAGIDGRSIDLGTGATHTVRHVVERIWALTRASGEIQTGALPYRAGELIALAADAERTTRLTAWRAQVDLDDGLQATIRDYLKMMCHNATEEER